MPAGQVLVELLSHVMISSNTVGNSVGTFVGIVIVGAGVMAGIIIVGYGVSNIVGSRVSRGGKV
jgi:hypothetical protein